MTRQMIQSGLSEPTLPPGYEAQPGESFLDPPGHATYELFRVYTDEAAGDARGPVTRLDESWSYWQVREAESGPSGQAATPASPRWLSFAEARVRLGARLRFDQFATVAVMRRSLPALLPGYP